MSRRRPLKLFRAVQNSLRIQQNFLRYHSASFDTLQAAAGNEGNTGAVMGAGMGLGMGVGVGSPMGNAMAAIAQNINPTGVKHCVNCGSQLPPGAKFCPGCGVKTESEMA